MAQRAACKTAGRCNGAIALVTSDLFQYAPIPEDFEARAKLSVYTRILRRAAHHLGGQRPLARYLQVPLPDLYIWLRPGAEPPPTAVFLKAVDLVLNDLDTPDAARAQKLRVAAIREDQRRKEVKRKLQALVPRTSLACDNTLMEITTKEPR